MPTLPTINVTTAQADRMLATYGSVANYKVWLVQAIKEYVVHQEALRMDEVEYQRSIQVLADKQAALDALAASLVVTSP